ncbi:hypothetical protein [Halorubrum sp. AJ67]|uniref:hypothetical protein n=1 Tax=Halorubrum sp. AJ67 TaxID=1173487 RepID=UPI0012AB3F97|nr:hypothetical protein [Halorubrum sp. AJ67]
MERERKQKPLTLMIVGGFFQVAVGVSGDISPVIGVGFGTVLIGLAWIWASKYI